MSLRFDVLVGRLLEFRFAGVAAEVEGFALVLCCRGRVFFVYVHRTHWIFCHLDFSLSLDSDPILRLRLHKSTMASERDLFDSTG